MKKFGISLLVSLAMMQPVVAQTLEKMQWFNEPEQWEVKDKVLTMQVTPQSDYWRISHYGFTVDDAPFYYATYGGEFEAKVKVTGDYRARFDQAGLMLRIDHENYIKAGIEYVDGKFNLSTVVTHHTSDWSVITLEKPVPYNLDKGRSPTGRCRNLLLFRRCELHHDAQCLASGQYTGEGRGDGSIARWYRFQSYLRTFQGKAFA